MTFVELKIKNLECPVCASNVDLNLEEVNGIEKATTDYAKQICKIKFDEEKISVDQIIVVIKENGYEV
jgi:copper chaperone CopZ